MDMIKPGASCRAIYDVFIRKVGEMNLPPISFVGHGIGLHPARGPVSRQDAVPKTRRSSKPAWCSASSRCATRPAIGFGMQNKDMMLVTETGCELLSDYGDTDKLLIIK